MDPIERSCRDCMVVFVIDVGEQAYFERLGFHLPGRCKPCRRAAKPVVEALGGWTAAAVSALSDGTLLCLDCGLAFTISENEKTHFAKLSYDLPKRCRPCRRERKAHKQREAREAAKVERALAVALEQAPR